MEIDKLTKQEALRLVTPVVDDEVCHQTKQLFFEHMKSYPEVNYTYKSRRKIKDIIKNRCPRAKAPTALYQRVESVIELHTNDPSNTNRNR